MRYNVLIGGQAGQGPNILSDLIAKALISNGYYVFYSRDYQSLIRGGHNFNFLSFSDSPIASNSKGIDLLIALDENTINLHKKNCNKKSIILDGNHPNMYHAGAIFKILNMDFKILDNELKELKRRYNENIKEATEGYKSQKTKINLKQLKNKNLSFMNGSQAISQAAINSGLDFYYAYPMTPATGVLTELAQAMKNKKSTHKTIQMENEIAVINTAIGSSMIGKKVMVGTSGGGFDLMTEALSLTGVAGIPLVIYLSQRPGPGTGVPTYTAQGDMNIALKAGHGEFPRIVLAPGDPDEAMTLTSEAFYFSQKYRIPAIIIGDKHLAESKYSSDKSPILIESKNSITKLERFNSYEKDKEGSATDEPEIIIQKIKERLQKKQELKKETKKFETYNIYGTKNSKNVIIAWGSTKGAIIDALPDIDAKFIQIMYLEPFPDISKELKNKNIIVIENNATSPLSDLISEQLQMKIDNKNKILKYDSREFSSDDIVNEVKKRT